MWYLIVSIPDLCTLTYFQDPIITYCRSKVLQGSILQYFRPSLSYHLSLRPLFLSIFEWLLKTGFTVYTNFHCPSAIKHFCLYVTAKLQQTGFSANSIKTHLCVGVGSPASPHLKITSKDKWASPCDKGPYCIRLTPVLKQLFINVSYHILVASLTLRALF